MDTYIMLTRLDPEDALSPRVVKHLEQQVVNTISRECPSVSWICNYASTGPYHYIDIFKADNNATANRVSTLIRTISHAQSEVWPVLEWEYFKKLINGLPQRT